MASSRGHIERTLADAYREEIDHEENVWRALPFFAATLACQLVAVVQRVDRLPEPGTDWWLAAKACLVCATLSTLTGLIGPTKLIQPHPMPL